MSQKLSVVIPTLNAQQVLPSTLEKLMEGVFAGVIGDLVIVDGGSSDATNTIAKEVGATFLEATPSRGGQIFAGVSACKCDWVLILHADSRLSQGWAELIPAAPDSERAYYFQLQFDAVGIAAWWVAKWANLRSYVKWLVFFNTNFWHLNLPTIYVFVDLGIFSVARFIHRDPRRPGILLVLTFKCKAHGGRLDYPSAGRMN